jgi:hypothetical protein
MAPSWRPKKQGLAMWTCEMQTRPDRCGKSKLTIVLCQPYRRLGSISKCHARIMLSMHHGAGLFSNPTTVCIPGLQPPTAVRVVCWCALAAQCVSAHNLSESNCSRALRSWGVKLHRGTEVATRSSAETRSDLLNATRPRPPAGQKRRRTDNPRLLLSFFLTTRPILPWRVLRR